MKLTLALLFVALAAAQSTKTATITITDTSNLWPGMTYNIYRLPGPCPANVSTPLPAKLGSVAGNTSGAKTYADVLTVPGVYCYFATAHLVTTESAPSNLVSYTWAPIPQPPTIGVQ